MSRIYNPPSKWNAKTLARNHEIPSSCNSACKMHYQPCNAQICREKSRELGERSKLNKWFTTTTSEFANRQINTGEKPRTDDIWPDEIRSHRVGTRKIKSSSLGSKSSRSEPAGDDRINTWRERGRHCELRSLLRPGLLKFLAPFMISPNFPVEQGKVPWPRLDFSLFLPFPLYAQLVSLSMTLSFQKGFAEKKEVRREFFHSFLASFEWSELRLWFYSELFRIWNKVRIINNTIVPRWCWKVSLIIFTLEQQLIVHGCNYFIRKRRKRKIRFYFRYTIIIMQIREEFNLEEN